MGPGSPRARGAHSPARAALRRSPSAGAVSPSVGGQPPSVIRCLPAILLSSRNCPLLLQAGAPHSRTAADMPVSCPPPTLLPCDLGRLPDSLALIPGGHGVVNVGGSARVPVFGQRLLPGALPQTVKPVAFSWESGLCPPVSEDEAMAALRWPRPSQQPGNLRRATHVAWSDYIEQPGPQGKACSYPVWSEADEAKDGDSSVSSGRLSGSSGGHESCTSPPGPWKEKPPQVLGPWRPARESNPRLEQLRDRIRAQAQWQASCASLGTSTRSSTSRLCGAPKADPQRKARKLTTPSAAPWDTLKLRSSAKGLGTLSVALCGVEDKAIPGRGREPSGIPQRQASGDNRKVGAAKGSPVRPRMPSPAFLRGDLQGSANAPSLASYDQPVTIQNALAVLRDLRQQIQTGLELAQSRHPRAGPELGRSKLWLQNLAGRKQQGPWSISDVRGPFSKSPQAGMEGKHSSLERAGSFPSGHHRNTLAGWESYPQKTGTAQGWNLSFQRPGSPPERLTSFPRRPWSASAGQASRLQRTGEAQGWNPSFLRSGSPPERLTSFPRRPWSASAGQTSRPQRTWTAYEDWDTPTRGPLSPLAQRAWSASFTQSTGTSGKGRGPLLPPSGVKRGWPRKEKDVRVLPPCQKPQGVLGHPYSSEALREFMHQKSLARRQQAMKEKASAVRALELRNQRLQDIYRKQREAVLSKAVPVVSQTTPGIVTFFPHCAQSRGLEAPGSLGSPVLEWSKVTSGMVLGDQEAPGSFCLCLNRALNRTETLETGGPQDGWEGTPVLMSARSSLGPLKLQDLTTGYPRPGVCIYLDPEESERLGMPGPLHFRYKQARLQALETMANVLKQRIDILTAKLHKSEAPDTVGDPVSDLSSSRPSMVPADPTPADPVCLGALVPNGSRGAPWDWTDMRARPLVSPTCFPGGQTLPRSPDWERRQSVSPRGHYDSRPRGFIEDGCLELDNRLARNTASFPALGSFIGSSLRVPAVLDPTCGSLQLEEMPAARGVGSVMPWTMRGCGQCLQHLANIPRKSPGFLKSLQPDLQEQEQALALLRQQAELEVWETQKALDQLLFKHCLQQLMKKHSTQARPDPASEREQPQVCGDLQLRTSPSTVTARPRSHPALGREAAAALQGPQDGPWAQQDKSASAEPRQEVGPDQVFLQLPQARLYARVNPTHQMLELSEREEKLRAQQQAALLRLREKTLEEKMRAELAWLEHQRRCLGSKVSAALLAALAERQQQALSRLEQEQREIRCLQNTHLFSHKERMLLLQHQKDILSLWKAVKHLQQEFQAWTRVPQSSGPGVKPAPMEGSKTSPQPKRPAQGSSCPLTPRGPRNLTSHGLQRSPERPGAQQLPIGQEDRTPPQATSATDSHRLPPRPVWGVDTLVAGGWPDTGGQLAKSHSPVGQGDPQPNPSSLWSKEETWPLKGSPPQELQGQCSLGRGAPCSPPKASQVVESSTSPAGSKLGLDFSSSPMEDPHQMESWWLGEKRIEPCWQEDPYDPFPQLEAAPLTVAPAPAPPSLREGSPLGLGPESESKYTPWSCSGSSARSHTASPVKELSCPSLQEFQKVSATLVQLSESSTSLLDWAAGDAPDREPGRSGSELSEASSKVWDEENLLEPGPGADPALGRSSLAGGSSYLENGGVSCFALPSLDLGKEQEASGTSGSMISGLHAEIAKQKSPEAARKPLPSKASSSSDLDLSLSSPSGSLTSEEVDFAKGGEAVLLQASAGRPQEPGNADLSPSNDKKPQEAGSEPKVPVSLRAPPGDPGSLVALTPEGQAPGHSGGGDSPALEEACPTLASRVLPEILSPVDNVLSHSSADLQSSTHRDASLPPPPPTFPAESEASPTSPHSEDFPPPPEDAMFPRGPPEEDASIKTGEVPSLSKKALPEALSLGPQESRLFLGAGAHSGSFEDKLGGSRSDGGTQAVGSGWSELVGWLGSPSWGGAGDAAWQVMLQPPAPSRVACMAGDGLPVLLVAGGTGLSGTGQRGPCIDPPGAERAEAVDLVSSQLTRRILCDSLAVVSELAQPAAR
ncbi:coiled-coil domain-containing protein 187 [Vulpes lagopus]|uniref:coiled-coil domain-containing protein 187 n=1 Tax=Vulpes lagopus TaxID=494514 RepID=UPI001BC97559|nr:coiled-coil domain-containing protein 187 [Vulpes lagopus]